MTVLALTSARGAPGVSTAALAMTLLWPRPALLAECDPAGGSATLAGYLRGTVEHSRGLLPLMLAQRDGAELAGAVWDQTVPLTDPAGPGGNRWLLPGLSDAAQAPGTDGLWGPLGAALSGLELAGTDVIVDAGRLGAAHAPTAVLRQADLVLLVLGSTLASVAAANARIGVLRAQLADVARPSGPVAGGGPDANLALLLVGQGRPFTAGEISGALGLPVLASLDWDPGAAEVLAAGTAPSRRFERSALVRSTRVAIEAAGELVARRRDRFAPPTPAAPVADPARPEHPTPDPFSATAGPTGPTLSARLLQAASDDR